MRAGPAPSLRRLLVSGQALAMWALHTTGASEATPTEHTPDARDATGPCDRDNCDDCKTVVLSSVSFEAYQALCMVQALSPRDSETIAAQAAGLTHPSEVDDGQPSTVATRVSRRRSLASRSADAVTTDGSAINFGLGELHSETPQP